MTTTWAAKVLRYVPSFTFKGNVPQPDDHGKWIRRKDALAAIARMGAGDGLVERISEPHDPGDFVGDIFYGHPIKTTMGTHRWTGTEWVALPSEAEALAGLLAEARKEAAALRERVARLDGAGDFARLIGNDDGKDDKDTVLVSYGMLRRLRAAIANGDKHA